MDARTLEQEALKLPLLERIQLADSLYASLETEAEREWNRQAVEVCKARCEAYERGETTALPAHEAIEQIRVTLRKR